MGGLTRAEQLLPVSTALWGWVVEVSGAGMVAKIHRHLHGKSIALEQKSSAGQELSNKALEADRPCLNLCLAI